LTFNRLLLYCCFVNEPAADFCRFFYIFSPFKEHLS
jgi:hypothetical protein